MAASNGNRGGEPHQQAGGGHPGMPTNQGVAIADNQNMLRAWPTTRSGTSSR